jgi:hypothetical protein
VLGPVLRVLILAAATTGLRQSELLGLRWRDVDWTIQRLRVRSAFVRGAKGMRTHVGDCCGLSCRSGGSGRCRAAHLACIGAAREAAADLVCDVQLAAADRPCSRDGIAWAGIAWSLRLEQSEHSLRAISRHTATIRRSASTWFWKSSSRLGDDDPTGGSTV